MTVARGDVSRVLLALTALFTFPGIPMLYYGDEIGLAGGNDPDCRRTMPWDVPGEHGVIRDTVRELARMRRDHPAIRRGSWEVLATFNRVIVFLRRHEADAVVVVLNAGGDQRDLEIRVGPMVEGTWRSSGGGVVEARNGSMVLPSLAAHTALTLERDEPHVADLLGHRRG